MIFTSPLMVMGYQQKGVKMDYDDRLEQALNDVFVLKIITETIDAVKTLSEACDRVENFSGDDVDKDQLISALDDAKQHMEDIVSMIFDFTGTMRLSSDVRSELTRFL